MKQLNTKQQLLARAIKAALVGSVGLSAMPALANGLTFTEMTGVNNPLDSVDIGDLSVPSFVDVDGDGNHDVFIGESDGTINYYENTGTQSNPTFVVRTGASNPLNGVDVGDNSAPSFIDIDDDGDYDAFIGAFDGTIYYYENTGTRTSATFTLRTGAANPFNGVDVGTDSAVAFVEIDGDNDHDAFIGAGDGTIYHYENTGSRTSATFTLRTGAANPLNGVDVGDNSKPVFINDVSGESDGDFDAFIGAGDGNIYYYKNTGSPSSATFTQITGASNPFNGVNVGTFSAPTFVEIDADAEIPDNENGDSDFDAFIGAFDGTINYYQNTTTAKYRTIDDFNDIFGPITQNGVGDTCATQDADDTGGSAVAVIIGDERDVCASLTGAGTVSVLGGDGDLTCTTDASVGKCTITWDGNDNDATTLDPTGLGGINFTDGNTLTACSGDDFQLDVKAISNAANDIVTFYVYTNGTDYSTYTLNVTGPAVYCWSESDFSLGGGSGADFSNVGAVVMEIATSSTLTMGFDYFIVTPVELVGGSFKLADGVLKWETAMETDNAGFNVYWHDPKSGACGKLNESLILAVNDASSYRLPIDLSLLKNRNVWLEDIDIHDRSTLRGPMGADSYLSISVPAEINLEEYCD